MVKLKLTSTRRRRRRCGVGGGLFLMLLVPLLADVTIDYLAAAAAMTGARSLTAIAEQTIGRVGALICASTLLLLSFGVLVSYCVVIKQLAPRLAHLALQLDSKASIADRRRPARPRRTRGAGGP